jgi:uncharacterized protein YdhG (YjbR/CyaY superfamily)
MKSKNEEALDAMNATTILISVLNQIGSVVIPAQDFLEVNSEDRQLSVEYDSSTECFTFKMKDNVDEMEVEDLSNSPKDYK